MSRGELRKILGRSRVSQINFDRPRVTSIVVRFVPKVFQIFRFVLETTDMASFKVFLLACIIFATHSERRVVTGHDIKCECGVFKYPTAETTTDAPLTSKAPNFQFQCDADGKESCSNMCKALAASFKEEGPQTVCELVKDTDTSFTPVIYYRACDDDHWTFTGLTSKLEICCKASKVVPCS